MARTTIDIETTILEEIKQLQKKEGRSLGRIVSQLLAEALGNKKTKTKNLQLRWTSRPMKALIDLSDKETLYRILDGRES
jgi:hypothetical protein